MAIFQTNVTKEDFKRAYTSCLKEAWVFHDQQNFLTAVKLKQEQQFNYLFKSEVEQESDFETNASSINIFETFQEIYAQNDEVMLAKWNQLWENDMGFEMVDYAGDAIIDGEAVGDFACEYFTYKMEQDNLAYGWNDEAISLKHFSFQDALEQTQKILTENNHVKYLYEAAFEYDNNNLKTRCDVLEIKANNHVNLYEVKATSSVKKEHFFDVAYQIYILEKNNFIVDNVYLVTLNPEYIYGLDREFNLSEEGTNLFHQYEKLTYEEVIADIQTNNLLEPFTNQADQDLVLQKTLMLNKAYKSKTSRKTGETEEVSFIEAYRILNQSIGLEYMFKELANCFSKTEEKLVIALFKNPSCQTILDWKWTKDEQKFFYKTAKKEVYCFHVLPWHDLSRENIFSLTGLKKSVKAEIYYNSRKFYFDEISNLESLGYEKFDDKHFRIFDVYKKQQQGILQPRDLLDLNNLDFLKTTLNEYLQADRVYMYDFETAKWALPRFLYSKTYQQIPFQYSIDIIHNQQYDYHEPETMYHYEFLSSKLTDPRPDFIVNFINDMLMKHKPGIYVAYNKVFEQMVLKQLSVQFPKYAKPLIYIAAHTIDLMDFFKGKKGDELHANHPWFLVYHPNFHGSYSIKKTQPALDNSLNYEDLTINKGDKASQTFRQYLDGGISQTVWNEFLKPKMIAYCNRDTLAMVVILKQVDNLVKNYEGGN